MYPEGHILASLLFARFASAETNIPFHKTAAVAIAVNCIDLDHLIYYYKDDGTANSLVLHPLHIYSGTLVFILALAALWKQSARDWFLLIIAALGLHMIADAIAWFLRYNTAWLAVLDLLMLPLLFYKPPAKVSIRPSRLFLFWLAVSISAVATQLYLRFVLKLEPQTAVITYILPNLFFALAAAAGYFLFRPATATPGRYTPG